MRSVALRQFGAMVGVALAASLSPSRTYAQIADPVQATNQVLALMNQERTSRGLAPLARHCDLDRAATRHVEDMVSHNFDFVPPSDPHKGTDGSDFVQREKDAGYPSPTNENLFAGSGSPQTAVSEWMKSTLGHREAILNPNSKDVGIAVGYRAGTHWGYYWAADFGGGGGRTCPAPQTAPEAGALHLTAITSSGRLWHTIRSPNGAWQTFDEVAGHTGDPGPIVDADVQVIGSGASAALHVCAINSEGRLLHAVRRPDGSWVPFGDVAGQAGDRGRFVSVALANVNGELHVCGVTSDGKLWHTIRRVDGSWFPLGDVKGQTGDPAPLVRVAATMVPDAQTGAQELYILGSAANGQVYWTVRHPSSWEPFRLIYDHPSDIFVESDVTLTRSGVGVRLYSALVTASGQLWLLNTGQPNVDVLTTPRPVRRISIGAAPDASQLIHLAAVTTDGGLWHMLGSPSTSWSGFGDVKGVAGDRGQFVSVSVDVVPG